MKKLLFLGNKNRTDNNIELNERKLHKQGFEIIYENNLSKLEKLLTNEELFYIVIDGTDEITLNLIKEITPTQNVLIAIENENKLKGFIEDKPNFKFIKKPYTTDELIFTFNHNSKSISNIFKGEMSKFFTDLISDTKKNEMDITAKFEEILAFIANYLNADSGSIMLLNENKEKLTIETVLGNSNFINREIELKSSISGWILEHKESMIINKKNLDRKTTKNFLKRSEIKSSLNILLENDLEIIGILNLNSTSARKFKETDLNIAEYFAKTFSTLFFYTNIIKDKNIEIYDLEEKNKDMENFVYSAFHDLKTPLFTLQGFLDTFKSKYYEKLDTEGVKYLMLISNSTFRLAKMLNDVFEFFKFDKLNYSFTKTNMSEIVNIAIDQLQMLIQDEDVKINKKIFDTKKIYVSGVAMYLTKIWTNLISNSIKYRKDTEPLIIELGVKDDGGDMLKFYIKDNGIGIEEKDFDFIFKLFSRTRTKEVEGTGVGLPIVKKIINKHGGDIWVSSEVGKGSTFYFSIPKY